MTIINSRLPDIDIPATDLPTFFFGRLGANADFARENEPRPLLVDGDVDDGDSLTLAELESLTTRLASGLYHTVGVRPGDVVAIISPNTIYYPAAVLATLMVGATCTLVNPAYTAREVAYQLVDSSASAVVAAADFLPIVQAALDDDVQGNLSRISLTNNVLVIGKTPVVVGSTSVPSVFDVLSDSEYPRVLLTTEQEAKGTTALLCYSSGTTGLPKGVMLSHRNVVANILQCFGLLTDDFTKERPQTTLASAGIAVVVIAKFEMARYLTLIARHKVTQSPVVPPIVNGLVKLPIVRDYDLSSLQLLLSGAAPLSAAMALELKKCIPNACVVQGYGATEACPALSLGWPTSMNIRSTGNLLASVQAKVIDDDGNMLGVGETGELCFRGPNIMIGYLNNEQATADTIDTDGFLHTGDIGYIDEDRFVYVTDRKKELIKFNGFQIAPAELEGLLHQHPSVRDVAVVGVYDEERNTEVPRAFLVLNIDDKLQTPDQVAGEVVEWLDGRVAYYKKLRGGYRLVDAIPKSASGKILRRMLK
ncbi:acetyl-CoA synthetase-like protein [Linderina pennispora]|uniref:Acetyl-CoA synthetase-like protein n=1 Tax=Linderina pennispora TaxID=61395 RepID=A0A1Y1VXP7_9FUNG|nr:acetyl-CoA synthetase-like protein [Linderina pennispora]ORX66060.1 acetyl-CoA synthetase-like protein [Linderina pennispora]